MQPQSPTSSSTSQAHGPEGSAGSQLESVTLSGRALSALDELCGHWKMLVTTNLSQFFGVIRAVVGGLDGGAGFENQPGRAIG
jgi:hypothetical protein